MMPLTGLANQHTSKKGTMTLVTADHSHFTFVATHCGAAPLSGWLQRRSQMARPIPSSLRAMVQVSHSAGAPGPTSATAKPATPSTNSRWPGPSYKTHTGEDLAVFVLSPQVHLVHKLCIMALAACLEPCTECTLPSSAGLADTVHPRRLLMLLLLLLGTIAP